MTPDNDLTMRSLFQKRGLGNTWIDATKYENTFGTKKQFKIGQGDHFASIAYSAFPGYKPKTVLEDKPDHDEDEYAVFLSSILPETNLCKMYKEFLSFGLRFDAEGNLTGCDMCGVDLNPLNSSSKHSPMCDKCRGKGEGPEMYWLGDGEAPKRLNWSNVGDEWEWVD